MLKLCVCGSTLHGAMMDWWVTFNHRSKHSKCTPPFVPLHRHGIHKGASGVPTSLQMRHSFSTSACSCSCSCSAADIGKEEAGDVLWILTIDGIDYSYWSIFDVGKFRTSFQMMMMMMMMIYETDNYGKMTWAVL